MLNLKFESLPNEIWKEVKDYENLYLVSNLGRVSAKSQKAKAIGEKFFDKLLVINPNSKTHYCQIKLWKNSKYKYFLVHRLVAATFNYNPNMANLEINHLDGIKYNNKVENLEWVTAKQNNRHAIETGLKKNDGNKDSQPNARPVLQLDRYSRKVLREFQSVREAARIVDINPQNIRIVCKGGRPTAKGFAWTYKDCA